MTEDIGNSESEQILLDEYMKLLAITRAHVELERKLLGDYLVTDRAQGDNSQTSTTSPALSECDQLRQLASVAASCNRCRLAQNRTQVVFGEGTSKAKLVIVGEAPGFYEDRQGQPFVGKAGLLLTKMLAAIQLPRQDVYICNVIKCRPPDNRDPQPDEIIACRDWLTQQLALLKPKLLLAMGKFAAQTLTGTLQAMWQFRGHLYRYQNIPLICSYHPAYLLRNPEDKSKAWQDLKKVREILVSENSEVEL